MSRKHVALFLLALIILGGLAWLSLRRAQGPELAAYRVQAQPLVQSVVATGRVASASRAQVGTQIAGVVAERRVREGDQVQAGDVLAVLRMDEFEARLREAEAALAQLQESNKPQADAALRRARAELAQAGREAARRRDLFQRGLLSREALEQSEQSETVARSALEQTMLAARALASGNPGEVEAQQRVAGARALLAKTVVRAQVDGTVLTRNAEPGDVVQPGRVLFEIAREGQTELLVPVDEKNLAVLALDQSAMCVADAYPQQPFPAVVSFIAPAVDPQRGSVDIRLRLQPLPGFLRQDMTVSVTIETGRRDDALVVPNDALDGVDAGQPQVWKVNAGRAVRTPVTLGLRGMALTEISSGLSAGDLVLASSGSAVVNGSRVRAKLEPLPREGRDRATAREMPMKFD